LALDEDDKRLFVFVIEKSGEIKKKTEIPTLGDICKRKLGLVDF
jgi:hypothetical protein